GATSAGTRRLQAVCAVFAPRNLSGCLWLQTLAPRLAFSSRRLGRVQEALIQFECFIVPFELVEEAGGGAGVMVPEDAVLLVFRFTVDTGQARVTSAANAEARRHLPALPRQLRHWTIRRAVEGGDGFGAVFTVSLPGNAIPFRIHTRHNAAWLVSG